MHLHCASITLSHDESSANNDFQLSKGEDGQVIDIFTTIKPWATDGCLFTDSNLPLKETVDAPTSVLSVSYLCLNSFIFHGSFLITCVYE